METYVETYVETCVAFRCGWPRLATCWHGEHLHRLLHLRLHLHLRHHRGLHSGSTVAPQWKSMEIHNFFQYFSESLGYFLDFWSNIKVLGQNKVGTV